MQLTERHKWRSPQKQENFYAQNIYSSPLAALFIVSDLTVLVAKPAPAGAQSEAGTEAPMFVGRRFRGRRRGYNNQQNNQQNQQQKMMRKQSQMTRKADDMDNKKRAQELHRLKDTDIIHEYGPHSTGH